VNHVTHVRFFLKAAFFVGIRQRLALLENQHNTWDHVCGLSGDYSLEKRLRWVGRRKSRW